MKLSNVPILFCCLFFVACTTIGHDEKFHVDRSKLSSELNPKCAAPSKLADSVHVGPADKGLSVYIENKFIYDWFGVILPIVPTMWMAQGRDEVVAKFRRDKTLPPPKWKARVNGADWQSPSKISENCNSEIYCDGEVIFDFPHRVRSNVELILEGTFAKPVSMAFTRNQTGKKFFLIGERFPRLYEDAPCKAED